MANNDINILDSDREVVVTIEDPETLDTSQTKWKPDRLARGIWHSSNHLPTEEVTSDELARLCREVVKHSQWSNVTIWSEDGTGRSFRNMKDYIAVHKESR
jgi:hypothetical protein